MKQVRKCIERMFIAGGLLASPAMAQVGHVNEKVAGINLDLGPDAGIATCSAVLEGEDFADGVSRIRVYLDLESHSGTAARLNCILRLKQERQAGRQLTILWAKVLGDSYNAKGSIAVRVGSTNAPASMGQVALDLSDFEQDVITEAKSGPCASSDSVGLFGIQVTASVQAIRRSLPAFASLQALDIYVKEDFCR